MPAKKKAAAKATVKKTASAKSKAPPKLLNVKKEIEILDERIDIVVGRLKLLETTVNAIRADFKSKGIPMP